MTAPDATRSHVVATWRDRQGQRWWHIACTCGFTYGAPTAEDVDAEALPHRLAGAEHANGGAR